jgi:hypothetical protein
MAAPKVYFVLNSNIIGYKFHELQIKESFKFQIVIWIHQTVRMLYLHVHIIIYQELYSYITIKNIKEQLEAQLLLRFQS